MPGGTFTIFPEGTLTGMNPIAYSSMESAIKAIETLTKGTCVLIGPNSEPTEPKKL
jgi:hypothetical protein